MYSIKAKRAEINNNRSTPFIDEISGLVIIEILDKSVQNTMMLKLKFTQNLATIDMKYSSDI